MQKLDWLDEYGIFEQANEMEMEDSLHTAYPESRYRERGTALRLQRDLDGGYLTSPALRALASMCIAGLQA